jgi:hypothetical protein
MKIERHEFGAEKNPIVIIDDFHPEPERAVEMAASLAPFPPVRDSGYPGLRHNLTPDHQEGARYARAVVEAAAPAISATFGEASLRIVAASLSVVTRRPAEVPPAQRLPHTDSYDENFIALLHNLHHVHSTGTGFYRHRRTGFERASEARRPALQAAWERDRAEYGQPKQAFFAESDAWYEKIFSVEARFNRLLIYQGALFHSGLIPEDFAYDPSPRTGRLMGMVCLIITPARWRS